MSESGDGERIAKLEEASINIKAQLQDYMRDHKEVHEKTDTRLDKVSSDQGTIFSKLDSIAQILSSRDKDKETRRIMVATIAAALFAGISPIVVALIN
jgi:septal ring factor EnvC (AmiA/AmiB activator)